MTKTPYERAAYLVSQFNSTEKIALLQDSAPAVPRLNLSSYEWWSEALHGVAYSRGVHFNAPTPYATSFPQVITTSATFNATMWHSIAQVISQEARAFSNAGNAGLTYWAPNINLIRDPRWGRGQETPGEDPYATGVYARNYVRGLQDGEDAAHLKVSSCCKHYYAYDLEDWNGTDRHHFNAIVNKQDETDTYLPAFHSCVVNGQASSIMCSYNEVNGVPSCANSDILTEIARGRWDFEGYITSDCGAVSDILRSHQYAGAEGTCTVVLEAGMDSDCGHYFTDQLAGALRSKTTPEHLVDRALVNLYKVQVRLGVFDAAAGQPYLEIPTADINTAAHQALALDAAREGVVLLKNDAATFPLSNSSIRTVAVIGPNANATVTMQGNYQGHAPYLISPVAGVQLYANATFAYGCDVACNSTALFAEAKSAAQAADAVVLVVGLNLGQETESHDRTSLALPGYQNQLIEEVAAAAKGPVLCVYMAGGPVDMTPAKGNARIAGVMWVGYPGQSGGQALAETVFGDNNPSGRLPATQYPADYLDGLSMFDMGMRPNASSHNPGRTYRFYPGPFVYEYGDGLSYTTFSYTQSAGQAAAGVSVSKEAVEAAIAAWDSHFQYFPTSTTPDLANVTVTVKNTGNRAGMVAVICFAVPPEPGVGGAPLKFNVGFQKVELAAGGEADLTFGIQTQGLSLVDARGHRVAVAGQWTMKIGTVSIPVTVQ
eukprot:gene11960-18457_t